MMCMRGILVNISVSSCSNATLCVVEVHPSSSLIMGAADNILAFIQDLLVTVTRIIDLVVGSVSQLIAITSCYNSDWVGKLCSLHSLLKQAVRFPTGVHRKRQYMFRAFVRSLLGAKDWICFYSVRERHNEDVDAH